MTKKNVPVYGPVISITDPTDAPQKGIRNSLGMEFVYIPSGTFVMGSPEDELGRDTDETQHEVTLTKGFYMQTTEVTIGQWNQFISETSYNGNADYSWGCKGMGDPEHFSQTIGHPVVCVTWSDVQAFVDWLNKKEGENYRLPTEAEWEYACRAGIKTRYYTGYTEDALARAGWYRKNSGGKTNPVGLKKANARGLKDMHGNAWEWCSDWYNSASYLGRPETDPPGPESGSFRVVRGGSWINSTRRCRTANRRGYHPGRRSGYCGFRLVLVSRSVL